MQSRCSIPGSRWFWSMLKLWKVVRVLFFLFTQSGSLHHLNKLPFNCWKPYTIHCTFNWPKMLGFKAKILWEGWRTGGVGALEEWGNGGEGTRGVENWRGGGLEGWGTGGGVGDWGWGVLRQQKSDKLHFDKLVFCSLWESVDFCRCQESRTESHFTHVQLNQFPRKISLILQ